MKTRTKAWLVIASSLVLIGLIMFALVMTQYNWNFVELDTSKYETNTYSITEEFNNISLNTDTADILFKVSETGKCKVECYEEENAKHSVTVKDDTLIIQLNNKKSWYDYVGINFTCPKITVYLPKSEYNNLSIKEDTGDIRIENISTDALELSTSTGDVTLSDINCKGDININVSTGKANLNDINCKSITTKGSTGDIILKNLIITEKLSIKRSTGDIKIDGSDASEIFIETDTGDVRGSLLTDKIFTAYTDTGIIDVPKTVNGGRCEITTDTGDIILKISDLH